MADLLAEFVEKAKRIHGDKFDYSKAIYTNNKARIEIVCPMHGSFWQTPSRHLSSRGCEKCRKLSFSSLDAFIKKANLVHSNKYDYSKANYIDNDTELEIICPEHGSFFRRPRTHCCEAGCPTCDNLKRSKSTKFGRLEKARRKFGDRFRYVLVKTSQYEIYCAEHGLIDMTLSAHLHSKFGCALCYEKSRRHSVDTFIDNAKKIHGDIYDYSKVTFSNTSDKVEIICYKHGSFFQKVGPHIYEGKGCKKCADRTIGKEEFIRRSKLIHGERYDYSKVIYRSVNHHVIIGCPEHGNFRQRAIYHLSGNIGCPKCNSSSIQEKVRTYISSIYAGEVIETSRSIIPPFELDFYLPEKNFAIEVNGNFFHSFNNLETLKQKFRHHRKATLCHEKNITLFQMTEHEISEKWDILKSMINHHLGMSKRIGARKCRIKEILAHDCRAFLQRTHIAGFNGATKYYGLFLDNQLILVCSFIKRDNKWEIMRLATELGYSIAGGFGKILKYFIKHEKPTLIYTYADRRWSKNAGAYQTQGFKLIKITKPGYVYLDKSGKFAGSRQRFQKHKLPEILNNYDKSLTEAENMFNHGYRRLWDAGHFKLELRL